MDFLGLSLDFPWIPEKNRAGGREIERAGGRAGIRMGFLENPDFLDFLEILENPGFFLAVAGPSAKKMAGQWKMSPETIFLPKK